MMRGAAAFVLVTLFALAAFAGDIRDVVGMANMGGIYWCPSNPQCRTLGWYKCASGGETINGTFCGGGTLLPVNADGFKCTDPALCPRDQLNDGADDVLAIGTRIIYVKLNPNSASFYPFSFPHDVTTFNTHASDCSPQPCGRLVDLVKRPAYQTFFAKPFSTIFLDIGPNVRLFDANGAEMGGYYGGSFGLPNYPSTSQAWGPILDGLSSSERADEKAEIKALTTYLLSNPSQAWSGKTFVIFNEEGDWELRDGFANDSYCSTFSPNSTRLQAMRDWINARINARQEAVNEARQAYPSSTVHVYNGLELNKVQWAMHEGDVPATPGLTCGATMTNDVVPYTHCDLYTYSFWDSPVPHTAQDLVDRLNYIKTKAPDSVAFGHYNVAITEFGQGRKDIGWDEVQQTQTVTRLAEAALA